MEKYFKYGLSAGALSAMCCILYFLASLGFGVNPLGGSKALSYFLMLSMFFLSLWYFRTKIMGGILHFHQGFALVLIQHFFCCVIFSLFVWSYLQLDTHLLLQHKQESKVFMNFVQKDLVRTMGQQSYDLGIKELEGISALDIALDELKKRFLVLLFFVFLSAFIMRRSPDWSLSR